MIGIKQNTEPKGLLESKKVFLKESKREFLKDGGKRHPTIQQCVRCGHGYVDLQPLNNILHQKYMAELNSYIRFWEAFTNHVDNSTEYPPPRDAENNIVKKLPRKPVSKQPLLCCHCIEI